MCSSSSRSPSWQEPQQELELLDRGVIDRVLVFPVRRSPLITGRLALSIGLALLARREETLIATVQFLLLPLSFVSVTFMQKDLMPDWMRAVADYNRSTGRSRPAARPPRVARLDGDRGQDRIADGLPGRPRAVRDAGPSHLPALGCRRARIRAMARSREAEPARADRVAPGIWRLRLPLPWPGVPHVNA
jgi:hypothetical protein